MQAMRHCLVMMFLGLNSAYAQPSALEGDADLLLIDWFESCASASNRYCCYMHGETLSVGFTYGDGRQRFKYIIAENGSKRLDCRGHQFPEVAGDPWRWGEWLQPGNGKTYFAFHRNQAFAPPVLPDEVNTDEHKDDPNSSMSRIKVFFNPMFMPLGCEANRLLGKMQGKYYSSVFDSFKSARSKVTANGNVLGSWTNKKDITRIEVEFSKKHGFSPVTAIWTRLNERGAGSERRFYTARSNWMQFGELWLPESLEELIELSNGAVMTRSTKFEWRVGDKVKEEWFDPKSPGWANAIINDFAKKN